MMVPARHRQIEQSLQQSVDMRRRKQILPARDIPDYVSPDGHDTVTFTRVPKLDEVPYPVTMEPNLVVEFYAKN